MKKKNSQNRICGPELAQIAKTFATEYGALLAQQPHLFRLAVREAEAVAAQTAFPCLVLPTLIEEKLGFAAQWNDRQTALRTSRSGVESAFAA